MVNEYICSDFVFETPVIIKAAVTDLKDVVRSKFSRRPQMHTKKWVDMTSSLHVRILREESYLALVGSPSRDGVSIKILVWRHLKPNLQLL